MGKHRRANPNPDYFKISGQGVDADLARQDKARLAATRRSRAARRPRPRTEPEPQPAPASAPPSAQAPVQTAAPPPAPTGAGGRPRPSQTQWLPIRSVEETWRRRMDVARRGAARINDEIRDLRVIARRILQDVLDLGRDLLADEHTPKEDRPS